MIRIQRQRTKGWRMPPNTVYVGRPSLWGNPYSLDDVRAMYPHVLPADRASVAVGLYRRELEHWGLLSDFAEIGYGDRAYARAVAEIDGRGFEHMGQAAVLLRGKDLACWCPLDQPCHADVLLELANA